MSLHNHKKHLETLQRHASTAKKHGKVGWQWAKHHSKLLFLGGASLLCLLLGIFIIWIATMQAPTVGTFADRKISSSTKIYDRTGLVVLYDLNKDLRRTVITSEQIPDITKNAVIAIEDKNFYNHIGIEPKAIVRAVLANVVPFFKKQSQGGSTITQQLIKNTLLSQQRSISRKIKEWVLAVKLEHVMTKDQILTAYLNESPYGGTIYGLEQASQSFFGVPASGLNLAQSAYLAAIPNAPSYYSPYGKHMDALNARKNLVLKNMLEQGLITQEEHDAARSEKVVFAPQQNTSGKAIHFVEYIRQYLEAKYGVDAVMNGGLKVTTTLDWKLQQVAEKTIHDNALENEKNYGASNSALIAIDPKTGQILSMVGSRDYSDRTIDGAFNVTTAGRQPGSSFKPIVYSRAFEKGFQPETIVFDIPTQFGPCDAFDRSMESPCYAPDNYDNKFLGPVSLRNALGQSRNVPAVQLLSMVGLPDALQTAKKLGLTTLDRNADRYGLTLVLGGGEVTLLDLTSVYGTFGNDGVRNPSTGILQVTDATGTILEQFTANPQLVMDKNAVRKLSSVLSDNVARTPLFGSNSFFYFGGRPVAGKTGTTSDNKDAWVIGYTPSVAVGVWTGNNDNKPMTKGSAISGPAWRTFMNEALKTLPYERPGLNESFPAPETDPEYDKLAPVLRGGWAGGESFWIDTISGKLATELTPTETKKEFVIPDPHSILYWVDTKNPRGPKPIDPTDNAQYNRWELEFQRYLSQHPGLIPAAPSRPFASDDVHTVANQPKITLMSPTTGTSVPASTPTTIQVGIVATFSIQKIDYYLNDQYIGSGNNPLSFSFVPADANATSGDNALKIIVTDSIYNRGELETTLKVQ